MIRLGIVDCDSSHSIEFTRRFNHAGVDTDQCVDGARVVLACPGSSQMSPERISKFTQQIQTCDVKLVEQPEEMLGRVDAILVLSLCGQAHLERVQPFLDAGLPAYVDKPFACSIKDAEAILQLARENNQVVFGSSALRFSDDVIGFQQRQSDVGRLHGAVSYGPAKRADGNPGLFHYGIHASEVLFTLMGAGCERVANRFIEGAEVVTGHWRDGRLATLRGNRAGATAYGFLAFCENGVIHQQISTRYAYRNLCREIVKTFETGTPAVPNEVTLEIVRFVLAALESEHRDGESVFLDSI